MGIDWHALFVPTGSIAGLIIRGSVMYLFILAAVRIFRREAGALSISDLVVIVLVADAAQNAMAGEYHSITEGMVLVGTIFGWSYLLDWLGYRSPRVYRLLHPPPRVLVENGRINRRNLRAELLTVDELRSHLREQGIEDLAEVRRSFLEPDGRLSVIRRDADREPPPPQEQRLPP